MKIGILTQQLRTNYGGLLQAYALQTVLEKEGSSVTIIRREEPTAFSVSRSAKAKFLVKYVINRLLGRPNVPYVNKKRYNIISSNTNRFIEKYLNVSKKIFYSCSELRKMHMNEQYDAYVVGSDQVWRPFYSPCITDYFLGFCKGDTKVKRISYAASFGVDVWEFNKTQEVVCKELIQQFNAVSVREMSGLELCTKYLGISAVHVLDPTMLLAKEEYINIVKAEGDSESSGDCFYYMLNMNDEKLRLISKISQCIGLKAFTVMPKKVVEEGVDGFDDASDDYVFPPVSQWLRAFYDARMVLTDSFHGCVFSIIFNKPFWVVGNQKRGNARFDSLLKTFNLEDRLIDVGNYSKCDFNKEINWVEVNVLLARKQKEGLDFLRENL